MRKATLVMMAAGTISLLPGADSNFLNCPSGPGSTVWEVLVHATTPQRTVVDGLQADDFTVKVNQVTQKVCGFKHIRWPVSIGILLDKSGSMLELHRVSDLRLAMEHFLSLSGPQDEYFLTYAGESAEVRVPFTTELSRIRAGLGDHPRGSTALLDGIYLALNELRKARHPVRALLVVSDGDDNYSRHTLDDVAAAFSSSPVPIFLIVGDELERRRAAMSLESWLRNQLMQLVRKSGGFSVEILKSQQLLPVVEGIGYTIRLPYLLYFSDPIAAGRPRSLKVEADRIRPRPLLSYGGIREYVSDP